RRSIVALSKMGGEGGNASGKCGSRGGGRTNIGGAGGARARKEANGMLDFEQQANQALASLDDDWHLLEGERTTFAIFFLPFPAPSSKARNTGRTMPHDAAQNSNPAEREGQLLGNVRVPYLRATNSKIPCCID
ncbi:hypothetical protein X777_01651, partial [Ooceraea biroi]